ncbi:MAG: hypothetical protein PGN13_03735 [Patulibacter minatonensis]
MGRTVARRLALLTLTLGAAPIAVVATTHAGAVSTAAAAPTPAPTVPATTPAGAQWALAPIGPLPHARAGAEPRGVYAALNASGDGLVGWSRGDVLDTDGSVIAQVRGGRSIGRTLRIRSSVVALEPDRGGAVALLSPPPSKAGRAPYGLRWSVLRPGASEAKGGVLATRFIERGPALATNRAGDAVAVWAESAGNEPPHIRAAVRRAGHVFGPVRELGQMDESDQASDDWQVGPFAVAMSDRGRALVVYGGRFATPPTVRRAPPVRILMWSAQGGGALRAPVVVGSATKPTRLGAGFDGRGRGYIAWSRPTPRGTAQLATWAPSAARPSTPRSLEPSASGEFEAGSVSVAGFAEGGAAIGWVGPRRPEASIAVAGPDGRPGAARPLIAEPVSSLRLVAGRQRRVLATWTATNAAPWTAAAAVSRGGARFGAASPTGLPDEAPFWFGADGAPRGFGIRGADSATPELVIARPAR